MRLKVFRIVPCLGNSLILKEFDSSKLQIICLSENTFVSFICLIQYYYQFLFPFYYYFLLNFVLITNSFERNEERSEDIRDRVFISIVIVLVSILLESGTLLNQKLIGIFYSLNPTSLQHIPRHSSNCFPLILGICYTWHDFKWQSDFRTSTQTSILGIIKDKDEVVSIYFFLVLR